MNRAHSWSEPISGRNSEAFRGSKIIYSRFRDRMIVNAGMSMHQTIQLGVVPVEETKLADLCRQYHVRELSVFGSAARGEMRPDSDIDLLVEFFPEANVDLLDHAGLMLDLSKLLERKVDLVSKKGLKPLIRASILEEARLVYAA